MTILALLCHLVRDPLPPHVQTIPCIPMHQQECDAFADRYEFGPDAWWCAAVLPDRLPILHPSRNP